MSEEDAMAHPAGTVAVIELQRVTSELGQAKADLANERRKNEQELNRRLDSLDHGQKELVKQFEEYKEKKIDGEEFHRLARKVDTNSRMIYIGIGMTLALSFLVPIVIHVYWK